MNFIKTVFKTIKIYFIEIKNSAMKEDLLGSAAEMAYMLTLSIFPLILSFMAIFSIIGNTAFVAEGLETLSQFAPSEVITVIQTVLKEVTLLKGRSVVAIIGFFTTLYLASNSISAVS